MVHRCPRCRRARAQRRTARNFRERAALAVLGYHPYLCLDCERRFLDRPLSRPVGDEETPVAEAPPPREERTPTLAITTAAGPESGRMRRRPRWVVDPGDNPLGRTEVYAIVLACAVLVLVGFAVLRLIMPESTGGVRLGGD